jgi:hypothetical protein
MNQMECWSTGLLEYCVLSITPLLHDSNTPVLERNEAYESFQQPASALLTISCASLTIVFRCASLLKLSA